MILKPMATEGKDAVWSMGDDTPIAPLARTPRPVYGFFRQRFAQVTNPPIDSLREACVIQLHTRLGPWPHVLGTRERLPGLSLSSPSPVARADGFTPSAQAPPRRESAARGAGVRLQSGVAIC
jgi:hypothetical protein